MFLWQQAMLAAPKRRAGEALIYVCHPYGLGLIFPIVLKPIYLVWMIFSVILGWFMTRLILSLLFYFVITPIGISLRLLDKDFLDLKKKETRGSYWNMRDSKIEKSQNYEKQF